MSLCHHVRANDLGTWRSTDSLNIARAYQQTIILNDSNVFITGGATYVSGLGGVYLKSCELFDINSEKWVTSDSMAIGRYFHTMTLLQDGKVLIAGGAYADGNRFVHLASCELYDPEIDRWIEVSLMHTKRAAHTATLLSNGNVLVTGGLYFDGINDVYLTNSEIYDPTSDKWTEIEGMTISRSHHTATLLSNEKVIVVGGHQSKGRNKSSEIFDIKTQTWTMTDSLEFARWGHTATRLNDSRVLIVGGFNWLKTCEIYDPKLIYGVLQILFQREGKGIQRQFLQMVLFCLQVVLEVAINV